MSLKQSHGFDLTRSFYEELCRKETNKIEKNNKLQPVFGRQNSEFIISSLARGIDIRVVIYSVRGLRMGLFSSKEFCQITQVETDIVLPSTTTYFINLDNTCYMFRPYCPSSGI